MRRASLPVAAAIVLIALIAFAPATALAATPASHDRLGAGVIDPIHVDNDIALKDLCDLNGWEGNGSLSSPYLINGTGWTIAPLGSAPLIYLGNTTKHVVISDWLLQGSAGTSHGIFLNNTSNVDVLNDTCLSSTSHGIYLRLSTQVLIRDCNLSSNGGNGISVESGSNGVSCLNNSCWSNVGYGISAQNSTAVTLEFNEVMHSGRFGIGLAASSAVTVDNNFVSHSADYGIRAVLGTSGTIYLNVFEYNRGSGTTYSKSRIQGLSNDSSVSFSSGLLGNRWLDWSPADPNKDGIVNSPNYDLDGGYKVDPYPLASVVGPPHDVTLTPGPDYVQVDWLGPNYTACGPLTGFILHRNSVLGTDSWPLDPAVRSYTDHVTSDFEGTYWLTASNGLGMSGDSPSKHIALTDLSDPVVTIMTPVEGAWLNTNTITVSWNAIDSDSAISLSEVSLDGGAWISAGTGDSLLLVNLSQGHHMIVVGAYDSHQNYGSDTANFTVDSIAPDLEITSPSNGSALSTSEVTVAWSAVDSGSGLESVELKLDSGAWMDVTSLSRTTLGPMGDGVHNVTLRASDGVGNSALVEVSFTVDTVAPSIHITSPEPSTLNTSSVVVTWTAEDAGGSIDHYEVSTDDGAWSAIGVRTNWTFSGLLDGLHRLNVKVVDRANNSGNDSVTVLIDATAPQLTIHSPAEGALLADPVVRVNWTASDSGTGLVGFEVWIDGTFADAFDATVFEYTTGQLSDGGHTAEVRATDAAGNVAIASVAFTVDTTAPVIEFVSPQEGTYINSTYVRVIWNVTGDAGSIDHFNISWDGSADIDIGTVTSWPFIDLSQGHHMVNVTAYDTAGNFRAYPLEFYVDTIAPQISILTPEYASDLAVANVTVSWSGHDATSYIVGYNLSVGGVDMGYIGNITTYDLVSLTDGGHTVIVAAYDAAGNRGTQTLVFTTDTTPPILNITSPANGSYLNQTYVTITWNASDATTGVDAMKVNVDGTGWVGTGRFYQWSQSYAGGGHYVLIRVIDRVGNNVTTNLSFFVDASDPIVTIADVPPYVNSTEIALQWVGSDAGSGVAGYEVRNDSGPWIALGMAQNHTFVLSEGVHLLSVRIMDNAGNTYTGTVQVTVDVTMPEFSSVLPLDGSLVTTPQVAISWVAEDNVSGIQVFLVRLDGGGWANVGTALSYLTPQLRDGPHTAEIRAYDMANNYAGVMTNFTIDSQAPVVTFLSPEEGAIFNSTSVLVSWNATLSPLDVLDHYTLSVDGSPPEAVGLLNTLYRANWSEGRHTINVTAFDRAGNNLTTTLHFSVDTLPPLVRFTYPTEGEILGILSIYVTWIAEDNASGIADVALQIDGGQWMPHQGISAQMFGVIDGAHIIKIRVHDLMGHVAEAAVNFTVDVNRPTLQITAPGNDTWLNDPVVNVTWTASDAGTGIAGFEAQVDDGPWQSLGLVQYLELPGLEEGAHHLAVRASDFTGKNVTKALYFSVDRSAPTVSLLAPADGALFASANITVQWSGSDLVSGLASCSLIIDGSWVIWMSRNTINVTELRDGTHTALVRGYDRAGNSATSNNITFEVDTTPPEIIDFAPRGSAVVANYTPRISFSEGMDRSSVVVQVSGQTMSLTWTGNNVTWTPAGVAYATTYSVHVAGTDRAGNRLNGSAGVTWIFTTTDMGSISGRVFDANGAPVVGATVSLDSGESVVTDAQGFFTLQAGAGSHNITITMPGFDAKQMTLSVVAGETNTISVTLSGPPGPMDPAPMLTIIIVGLVVLVVTMSIFLNRRPKK